MANIVDFGIVKADVLKLLNPELSPHAIQVGAADSGTGGVGADTTWTVSGQTWDTDQWTSYYLVVASIEYLITANTATVISVAEDLSAKSGAWSIQTHHPEYSDTEFASLVAEQVALVKGNLPHKYQEMLYEIHGEIIVLCATALQTAASLGFATSDTTLVRLYQDYTGRYGSRDRESDSMGQGATKDFTIDAEGKQDITFVGTGLSQGSKVYADYPHALPTVPKILKAITIRLIAYEMYRATLSAHPDTIEHKDYEQKDPTGLMTQLSEGKLAIDELDKLILVVETDRLDFPGYGSVQAYRG